jgi:hypothetical protein
VLVLVLELNAGVVSEVYMSDLLASSRALRLVPFCTKPSSTSTIWLLPCRAVVIVIFPYGANRIG